MNRLTDILSSVVLGTCVVTSFALAGAGGAGGAGGGKGHEGLPPKVGRLGVPQHVMCQKVGDQLTLTWDAVDHAEQYRIYLEASDGGELVDTVAMSPYTHAMSDMSDDPATAVTGHVRALGSKMGKDASKPSAQAVCE